MVKNAEGAEVQNAEHEGVQNAECRVKGALVGAIHESPENERISVCFISTGRGGACSSRNERISRIKAGEHSSPLQ